jgi:phosphomannomutase
MTSTLTSTDGWRGLPGPDWSELDLLAAVEHAASTGALGDHVLIGFDTRAGSCQIAQLIMNLLQARHVSCRIATSPAPTPAIGRLVNSDPDLTAGVIATASHNPPGYVGVKLRDSDGLGTLWNPPPHEGAVSLDTLLAQRGPRTVTTDVARHYAATIGQHLTHASAQFDGCVIIDAAHGAVGILATHLPTLRWTRTQPLPFFAGQTPDPTLQPDTTALAALRTSHDPTRTVIALVDGDGDRLVLYTPTSGSISSAEQTALLLAHGLPVQHLVCSNVAPRMVTATAKHYVPDISITQTGVGFKHLISAWRSDRQTPTLGMEPNGAFVWAPHPGAYFERDSLASLATMLTRFPSVEALDSAIAALRQIHPHPQQILTVATDLDPLLEILNSTLTGWDHDTTRANLTTFTSTAGDHIAVRASGTEAAIRIYVEASPRAIHQLRQVISTSERNHPNEPSVSEKQP